MSFINGMELKNQCVLGWVAQSRTKAGVPLGSLLPDSFFLMQLKRSVSAFSNTMGRHPQHWIKLPMCPRDNCSHHTTRKINRWKQSLKESKLPPTEEIQKCIKTVTPTFWMKTGIKSPTPWKTETRANTLDRQPWWKSLNLSTNF